MRERMTLKKFNAIRAKYCKAIGQKHMAELYAEKLELLATVAKASAVNAHLRESELCKALWAAEQALRAERVYVDAS